MAKTAGATAGEEVAVASAPASGSPFSLRLSAPLLQRLEVLARGQHRKRGDLIQQILWEYVSARTAPD